MNQRPDSHLPACNGMPWLNRSRLACHNKKRRRAAHPVVRYLAHIAPACFVSALLGFFGLSPFEWQYWAWLVGFAALELVRDVAGARK